MRERRHGLLDVNVLIALFTPTHVHHQAAHDWFDEHHRAGWATCPLVETGFLGILNHPSAQLEDDRHLHVHHLALS